MTLCTNCAAELIPGAKFCHRCGDKMIEKTKPCPVCSEDNPLASVFCHHCGFHFDAKKHKIPVYEPAYVLLFDPSTLADQIRALFFRSLRQRVGEEYDLARYSEFVERFYQSRFREIFDARAKQIAEDVFLQWERFGTEALTAVDQRIDEAFDGLLDFFIIQYCPDLSGMLLPSAILQYEHAQGASLDLQTMIRDFLAFDREPEVFYFDFLAMPEELLANACKGFLNADRAERVFFIGDLSLKGNCKEGFAMSSEALYWRAPFGKARRVRYQEIRSLQKGKDWLLINGHFFTVNPSMNLKLYKLLKKLRQIRHTGTQPSFTAAVGN